MHKSYWLKNQAYWRAFSPLGILVLTCTAPWCAPLSPNATNLTQFYDDLKSILADSQNNPLSTTNNKRLLFGLENTNLTHYNGPFLDTSSQILTFMDIIIQMKKIVTSQVQGQHILLTTSCLQKSTQRMALEYRRKLWLKSVRIVQAPTMVSRITVSNKIERKDESGMQSQVKLFSTTKVSHRL